jgi:hypothetical protein
MNKELETTYQCHQCEQKITGYQNLYTCELKDKSHFCSKSCLNHYFVPHRKYFNRDSLGINILPLSPSSLTVEGIKVSEVFLQSPWEADTKASIYQNENCYYFKIEILNKFNHPIYVLTEGTALEINFIHQYLGQFMVNRKQKEAEADDDASMADSEEFFISTELSLKLDQMRSELLADFLKNRSKGDIGPETHDLYAPYLTQTMEHPDEMFEANLTKKNSCLLQIFCKQIPIGFLPSDQAGFTYIVICYLLNQENDDEDPVYLPLLSFPTRDRNLIQHYQSHQLVNKHSLN